MRHSHKLFLILALASFIQISFAMGGKPPAASEPNGFQNGNAAIRITNNEKLEFLDSKGQTRDQISLGTEKVLKPGNKAQIVTRNAIASKDGSRAILIESKGREFIDVTPSDGEADDTHKETSHLKVLDKSGNIIWKKQLPDDRLTTSADFSTDGKILATIQIWTNYTNAHRDAPVEQLVVYDEIGNNLFSFPIKKNNIRLDSRFKISPSGRFIAVRGNSIDYKNPMLIVFDISDKKMWEKDTRILPRKIEDNGTLLFSPTDTPETEIKFLDKLLPLNE